MKKYITGAVALVGLGLLASLNDFGPRDIENRSYSTAAEAPVSKESCVDALSSIPGYSVQDARDEVSGFSDADREYFNCR